METRVNDKLETILTGFGVKVGRQNYTYHSAGEIYSGENVYGILQAPRGDATEAIVLVAAWRSIDELLNRNGVALVLTLARYFKRQSLMKPEFCAYNLLISADNLQVGLYGPRILFSFYLQIVQRVRKLGLMHIMMPMIPNILHHCR